MRSGSDTLRRASIAGLALGLIACGSTPVAPPPAPADRPTAPPTTTATDRLGPRPTLADPRPYEPPAARLIDVPGAPPVWLFERHDLPLVVVHVVVPYGSASDPPGQGGLAAITAEMMEKGAGRVGAAAFAQALQRLGADLEVSAERDLSDVRLSVLAPQLEPALALLADVVARPRFEPDEWRHVKPHWIAALRSDAFDPPTAAHAAADAALFGEGHPYGHPVAGTPASVERVKLEDVRRFHRRHWRPDRATVVLAGPLSAAEATGILTRRFLEWSAVGDAPPRVTPPAVPARPGAVVVARPDAPQTFLLAVVPGPPAADAAQPALTLANHVLGGMFTSRLNQRLREEKGYTYGASSTQPFERGAWRFAAQAAVNAESTGAALADLQAELGRFTREGPTAAELAKARATGRGVDLETFEPLEDAADRLARLAALGLTPAHDAEQARVREALSLEDVRAAAAAVPWSRATVVGVGDPAAVREAFRSAGLRLLEPAVTAQR